MYIHVQDFNGILLANGGNQALGRTNELKDPTAILCKGTGDCKDKGNDGDLYVAKPATKTQQKHHKSRRNR
jgi:hypothetical protein